MTTFRAGPNPADARPKARTATRSLAREAMTARAFVLAAAFTMLVAAVLAQIGG